MPKPNPACPSWTFNDDEGEELTEGFICTNKSHNRIVWFGFYFLYAVLILSELYEPPIEICSVWKCSLTARPQFSKVVITPFNFFPLTYSGKILHT